MAELLHVFDLPQLYQRPTASELRNALELLVIAPSSFNEADGSAKRIVSEEGVPRYLTTVISSSLSWIDDDSARQEIRELASQRLCERSGRTAMGDLTRSFQVTLNEGRSIAVNLHEPALTGDNLGLKTWSSSFVLANNLRHVSLHVELREALKGPPNSPKILELGAGTGLVGLTAAILWSTHVALTDLPEITGNLTRNIYLNRNILAEHRSVASSGVLDWSKPQQLVFRDSQKSPPSDRFPIVLAADPIYSPDHPSLLVAAINAWLRKDSASLFILAYPIREAYGASITSLRAKLLESDLSIIHESNETSTDDWKDSVTHSWSIWGYNEL